VSPYGSTMGHIAYGSNMDHIWVMHGQYGQQWVIAYVGDIGHILVICGSYDSLHGSYLRHMGHTWVIYGHMGIYWLYVDHMAQQWVIYWSYMGQNWLCMGQMWVMGYTWQTCVNNGSYVGHIKCHMWANHDVGHRSHA